MSSNTSLNHLVPGRPSLLFRLDFNFNSVLGFLVLSILSKRPDNVIVSRLILLSNLDSSFFSKEFVSSSIPYSFHIYSFVFYFCSSLSGSKLQRETLKLVSYVPYRLLFAQFLEVSVPYYSFHNLIEFRTVFVCFLSCSIDLFIDFPF
jgi:hypothetical protein